MAANRIFVLNEILNNNVDIVVTNLCGFIRYLPSQERFKNSILKLEVGKSYNLQELKKTLVQSGYTKVNKIDQTLQFASRGDILDIFSVNFDDPIRIEFFGDEIESIKYFDIASQTSKNNQLKKITILPANDFLYDKSDFKIANERIHAQLEKDKQVISPALFDNLLALTDCDLSDLYQYNYNNVLYRYYSFVCDDTETLSNYVKGFTTVFVDEPSLNKSYELISKEEASYLSEMVENGRSISHLSLFKNFNRIALDKSELVHTQIFKNDSKSHIFNVKNVPFQATKDIDALQIIQSYITSGYKLNISLSSKSQLNTLLELFNSNNFYYEMVKPLELAKKNPIGLSIYDLPCGFDLEDSKTVFLTSKELFNEKVRVSHYHSHFKEATIINSYEDLTPGDYIVHEFQGIGQFIELQTMKTDNGHQDYLKLAYAGGEILYVPVTQFHLIKKYVGKEGAKPRLTKLHSKDWEKTKERIKTKIHDLAERLFNLYVERSKAEGFAFAKDDEFSEEFESKFEHPLTADQKKAISEIKKDMESNRPMDRLLCGDVGFGKTEVAFQAAFKAINSGKQAAILCPTTLLARQHFDVAVKRFAPFDIKVALFSRFVSDAKQKEYIKDIKEGKIHLIIGTHRLLSKDIEFKDLGLLIVDEEQRFGVEQKERIKELKNNIDVLTLTATPIPRTLQISLLGVRSLSQINTAPVDRMPIQTYVTPYNFDILKELMERELGRDGQIFYLHNNTESIYYVAEKIKKALPDVTVEVVHGKMNKSTIEDVMMRFYAGDVQILVCTSIVENGIDVPNANMIIVEDSDHYGLAQLYQIKGRVGRGDRIAYAYLTYNGNKILKEDASKRLKALQDFTALGSGYRIAQRDLMIRGAGDILGPEQAGFIDSIGLDMYIKLLNEAVQEKVEGKEHVDPTYHPNITIKMDAYIPKEYANDKDKLELYQNIVNCSNSDSLLQYKNTTRDIYGKLPNETELLFVKRHIQLLIEEIGTSVLKEFPKFVEIYLGENFINIKGIGNILFEAMIPYLSLIKISYVNHKFKIVVTKSQDWINDLLNILKALKSILDSNIIVNNA
ncbi:MAG: transcription-repair coupling factor [Bacilli bacterium]|nr:transcription-repair coupling factor [Bacilli bacterium]